MIYAQTRILEKVMHKIFWNFEIQTDHQIPARRLDQKSNLQFDDFYHRVKRKENEIIDKYLDFDREL